MAEKPQYVRLPFLIMGMTNPISNEIPFVLNNNASLSMTQESAMSRKHALHGYTM